MKNLTDLIENIYSNSDVKKQYVSNGKRVKQNQLSDFVITIDDPCEFVGMGCAGGCNFGTANKVAGFSSVSK